jgi:DNA/RNA endonuclease G (NUC1)
MFSISGTAHDFNSIRCKKPPQPTIKQERRCDIGNGTKYNIGFNLKRKFLGLIEVCYDTVKHSTLNTRYILSKSIGNPDVNDYTNIRFTSSNFNRGHTGSLEDMYSCKNQIRAVEYILGSITQANKYINCDYRSNMYLDRCHLAPYDDFLFGYQKKAVSFFINTAPQWKAIHIGNWDILERRIRRYANKQKADLTIVTGTINITTLPDIFGTERYVYLPEDTRSSPIVPVPALFWKLVYDKARSAGIVFVVVNNPYDHDLLTHGYVLCTNICSSTSSWFDGWNRLDVSSGYVYCCTVNEFATKSGITPFPFRAKYVLR